MYFDAHGLEIQGRVFRTFTRKKKIFEEGDFSFIIFNKLLHFYGYNNKMDREGLMKVIPPPISPQFTSMCLVLNTWELDR